MTRYRFQCDLIVEGDEPLEVLGADFFKDSNKILSLKFKQEIRGISNASTYKMHDGIVSLVNEINAYNKRMTCKKRVKEANDEKTI